jgi:hypothetical protein
VARCVHGLALSGQRAILVRNPGFDSRYRLDAGRRRGRHPISLLDTVRVNNCCRGDCRYDSGSHQQLRHESVCSTWCWIVPSLARIDFEVKYGTAWCRSKPDNTKFCRDFLGKFFSLLFICCNCLHRRGHDDLLQFDQPGYRSARRYERGKLDRGLQPRRNLHHSHKRWQCRNQKRAIHLS